jgi:uncharacterized integral membrane protein
MSNVSTVPTGLPSPPPAEAHKRNPRDIARIVAALIIVGLLIAFVVENSEQVNVHFVFFSHRVSLIWALVIAAVLGVLADRLFLWRRRRTRSEKAARR